MILTADYYDEDYFDGGKGYFRYNDAEHFKEKAYYLAERYNPKTVLDVGSAKGFLVKALREIGIKAYGVDISAYAINQADEAVQQYLLQTDITNNKLEFPIYDLIVSYDTLEHIPIEKVKDALTFIKDHSKKQYIVVATPNTPDWGHDDSHVTIQDIAWWKKQLTTADWEESR